MEITNLFLCKLNLLPISVNKIYFLLITISVQLIQLTETSNLPLLSASLRTFQTHACDGQQLILECLPNTVINIYVVNYGPTIGSQLCQQQSSIPPSSSSSSISSYDDDDDSKSSPLNPSNMIAMESTSSRNQTNLINQPTTQTKPNCQTTDNLRYSLLNKAESACREQQSCKIITDPKSFGGLDPCPGITKFAEIAYKCRPNTFYNKIVCEDNKMRLSCKKYHRIIIYSAFFGSTKSGVAECPKVSLSSSSQVNNNDECSIRMTTEKAVSICNGLRNCELIANRETFDKPGCTKSTRLHLKIVYACVRREVLKSSIGKSPGSPGGASDMIYPDEIISNDKLTTTTISSKSSSSSSSSQSSSSSSTVDYSGYMGAPRVAPEDDDKDSSSSKVTPSSSIISSESYLKSKELLNDPIRVPIKDGLGTSSSDSDDPYHGNHQNHNSSLLHPRKALGFMVDWLSAYKFIKDKAEMIAICLILSIVVASLLFLVFLSTNQLMILRHPNGNKGKSNSHGAKKKKPFSPKKSLKSSPFRVGGGNGSGRCEIDGLDDTTVDQLLEELDPVLVNSIGVNDSLNDHQMVLTSSHHSFHDFRAHSKPLITDGLPYPASSGQTLSFTSSLSRGGCGQGVNRLSFGRPIQPPTAPIAITPPTMAITPPNNSIISSQPVPPPPTINCLYHQIDSSPRAMTGTVNSYF